MTTCYLADDHRACEPVIAVETIPASTSWLLCLAGLIVCGSCAIGVCLASPIGLLGPVMTCAAWPGS